MCFQHVSYICFCSTPFRLYIYLSNPRDAPALQNQCIGLPGIGFNSLYTMYFHGIWLLENLYSQVAKSTSVKLSLRTSHSIFLLPFHLKSNDNEINEAK